MAWQTLRYDTDAGHVATITLDRPEALNAFNRAMCDEFREVWAHVREDDAVHAVVLRASPRAWRDVVGEVWARGRECDAVHAVVLRASPGRAFCAGLDAKSPYGQPD